MRPLSAVERFFERLFERPSTWLLGARVHPVHLLRRLERTMEHGRRGAGVRTVVPDRFTIRLHPDDLRGLGPRANLPAELAAGATAFARRHGYRLGARPQVEVVADRAVRPGEVEVAGIVSGAPGGSTDAAEAALGRTRIFETPAAVGPAATLVVREPRGPTRTFALDGRTLVIGRSAQSDLVLADVRASRRHARLANQGGHLVLTDLGSSNGTLVNGRSVREVAVGAGDEIRIGDAVLTVALVPDDPGVGDPGSPAPRPLGSAG